MTSALSEIKAFYKKLKSVPETPLPLSLCDSSFAKNGVVGFCF